ncbi:cytochrome d ubiquinol oxidase subunit II [Nonomuraea sp. KC401]|uniref:cytochrome d ubiquinol oxidase subunit II n=1 Tax=unclassified Nonomuraea TaxID=2593643 RepID=UPI0010FCF6A1|nr:MULTISPECIES: cytochrome d ubiquinol oxidase subunit II [unclassified Nonomuraea]NBE93446.1 cytochrome d ubiquinol oxidase subunit II [Nonomuraea sp. K271]TLF74997.1 cytochrome d ubiquinol oxidase subunit II [Nonomuraea sp. KC401]
MEIFILAFFALGYLVLAGADIGVGMALPYLGRSAAERREVIASIAPFFLGNEVWLVATAGVLAGLFPHLESVLLTGNHSVVVVLLLAWVVRDMGLWLRGRMPGARWQAFWDGATVAGSWGLALSWGLLLGNVLLGITGPFAVLPALVVTVLFGTHGLTFAALRLRGELRARAAVLSGGAGERRTYALTSAALVTVGALAGLRLPLDPGSAGTVLVPVVLTMMPLLVAAQAWVWWTFRHRVTGPSYL